MEVPFTLLIFSLIISNKSFSKIISRLMSYNVGFTRSFGGALCQFLNSVKAYLAAKICPKCLPEPANAGPQGGGRRASLARRAEHPRSYGTAGSAARKSCCAMEPRHAANARLAKEGEPGLFSFIKIVTIHFLDFV